MPESVRRSKIEAHKRQIAEYLHELDEADDLDLWEEAVAKLGDVLVIYRRAGSPALASMSDEHRAELAFRNAVDHFMLGCGPV